MSIKNFTLIKTGIMKQILTVLAIAGVMASCSSNPKTGTEVTKDVVTTDTSGLYNDQNRVINVNGANDTTITTVTTTTVTKAGTVPLVATESAPVKKSPARSTARRRSSGSSSRNGAYSSGSGTSSQPSQTVAKKKGWSKAAKGTVIGAGSGAVIGAVISKKKGKGAIIGGVLGAGVGYGIGRSKDKKDGRVN